MFRFQQIDRRFRETLAHVCKELSGISQRACANGNVVKRNRRFVLQPGIAGRDRFVVFPAGKSGSGHNIHQHQRNFFLACKLKRTLRRIRAEEFYPRHGIFASLGKSRVAEHQNARRFARRKERTHFRWNRLFLNVVPNIRNALDRVFKALLTPKPAEFEDFVFKVQFRLRAHGSRVRLSAFGKEQRGCHQRFGLNANAVLFEKELAEAFQFVGDNALKIVRHQVAEHDGIARRKARADCRRKIRLVGFGVFIRLQRVDDGLARNPRGVGLMVAFVELFSGVGGEYDDRVAEGNVAVRKRVVQVSRVEYLQKELDDLDIRLFNFVEQENAVRVFVDKPGQRSFLCVLEARREADEDVEAQLVGKRRHFELFKRQLQRFRGLLGKERFTYARRACKHKDCAGTFSLFVRSRNHLRVEDPLGKSVHGVILPQHSVEQSVTHTAHSVGQLGQKRNVHLVRFGDFALAGNRGRRSRFLAHLPFRRLIEQRLYDRRRARKHLRGHRFGSDNVLAAAGVHHQNGNHAFRVAFRLGRAHDSAELRTHFLRIDLLCPQQVTHLLDVLVGLFRVCSVRRKVRRFELGEF
ncbi:hypothetical protein SDC9_100750 [bioreactor metagenome]|uniref:Uncharacterized protein n=1 Tax=bioreactor metagenome TaxID=1076179 RepID=A0A645AMK6_9ZZZZ